MHASRDAEVGQATETTAMGELFEKLEAAEKGRQHAEKALKRLEWAVDTIHIGVTMRVPSGSAVIDSSALAHAVRRCGSQAGAIHRPCAEQTPNIYEGQVGRGYPSEAFRAISASAAMYPKAAH